MLLPLLLLLLLFLHFVFLPSQILVSSFPPQFATPTLYLSIFALTCKFRMQGTSDPFYVQKQLLPENFKRAADNASKDAAAPVTVHLRMQDGYDHSYFFISSFAEDHVRHAAKFLFADV